MHGYDIDKNRVAYEVDMRAKGYNYLIGKAEKLDVSFNIDKRIDPDTCGCKELYDDFIEAFFLMNIVILSMVLKRLKM